MYDSAVESLARGELDWERDLVKVMLVIGDYRPSQTGDSSLDDVRAFEVEPSGTYVRGGDVLGDREVVRGAANDILLHAGSVSWDDFTGQFRYAVTYRAEGGQLVGYADLGRQQAENVRVSLDYDQGFAEFILERAA